MMRWIFALCTLLLALAQFACGRPGTYVIFAQNAKTDADVPRVITLRMPLEGQPDGAMIFCATQNTLVFSKRLDNFHVTVRDPDGEVRNVKMDDDGSPAGQVTYWPNGSAQRCGIAPTAPAGTNAYVMWSDVVLFMLKTGADTMTYGVGSRDPSQNMRLHYPLTDADRAVLHKNSVPIEIVNMLF